MMRTFAKMARQTCNECGSGLIQWTTVAGLVFLVQPEMRKRVFELAGFCGNNAEAWACGGCENFGAFAPMEMAL